MLVKTKQLLLRQQLLLLRKHKTKQHNPGRKNSHFQKTEDKFIADGLRKHGQSRWTAILNDCSYKFHPSRKASTLAVRAKSKHLV